MSGYDPGGGNSGAGQTPDLSSLQENFNQQQARITALRELVRQTESAQGKKTASAQEKVKNIAQRLTQYKTKATKSRLSRASSSEVQQDLLTTRINEESFDVSGVEYEEQQHMSLPAMPSSVPVVRARSETPGSEKFNLLRQQMEQNRLKMAARESHKREMEERVIELKHKLESTQQTLERSVEFGRSTGDLTLLTPMKMGRFEFNKSTSDLTQLVGSGASSNFDVERLNYLEGRVKVLEQELTNKETVPEKDEVVRELERKILDLEEALKEKECIIDARTQAVSLMTENLSLKGKNTVDLLEDTKQEMYRMQTNFVQAESNMKAELDRLQVEVDEKNSKISNLEEMNNILETARYDLTVENASLKQKLEDVQDFSTKISELNKLNQSLQHRITELESQKYDFITDAEAEQAKFGESDEKYQELLDRIQELEEELSRKATPEEDLLEKIRSLEATIQAQKEEIDNYKLQHAELQENLQEKTVELNVLNANFSVLQEKLKNAGPKPLFPKSAEEEAEVENSKLKQQLDEANKSMIKSKLKIKQLQKQVDSFKKTSAVHEEVVRLTDEVQTLAQRLAEVEEEKGNLQLHLVNYDGSLPDSELEKRIKILETTCQNQTTAIQLLEEQKLDINEDLNASKHELEKMRDQVKEQQDQADQSGSVISHHMSSIETEEQLEKCVADRDALGEQIQKLEEEKIELQQKLDQYMVENIELLDRIEKLSLEKVSSAESIEIVEGLTAKEKQEIESFEKACRKKQLEEPLGGVDEVDRDRPKTDEDDDQEDDNDRMAKQRREEPTGDSEGEDLNSSLVKLREESSELMHKIELFTNERREVLEKLEALTVENQGHMEELDRLRDEHQDLLEKHSAMEVTEKALKENLARVEKDKAGLVEELEAAKTLKVKLESETSTPSSSQSTPSKTVASAIDKSSFEQALRSVDNEVTNYNRNKDKNKKLQISKKLSTDAKNLQKMANSLLEEYYRNVTECEVMKTEIEQLKEKVQRLPEVDRCEEVNALKAQIMEITHAQIEKVEQIDQLRDELDRKNEEIEELKREMEAVAAREAERSSDEEPELLKVELNCRNDEISELKKELEVLGLKKAGELEEVHTKLVKANKEIDILKEQVAAQLFETHQKHENEIAAKLKDIQNYENQAQKMKDQLEEMSRQVVEMGEKYSEDMKRQLEDLKELTQNQNDEIEHKQETIDTLNNQIIELYKSMEENANKIIEKEDEVQYLQELLDSKKDEIQMLYEKLTVGNKTAEDLRAQLNQALSAPVPVVDESKLKELEHKNHELDAKNKEQLEKLKKFAANLKKKNTHCQDLEQKLATTQRELDELKNAASAGPSADDLKEENEQLSQKMHHLNNELHKLLQHKYNLEADKQAAQHAALALKENIQTKEQQAKELEAKLQEVENQLAEQSKTLETVQAEDASKAIKIEKCKAIIKEKNKEIQRLQEHERKTSYLQDEIKIAQSKLEDFHKQTMTLGRLKTDKEELNEELKAQSERCKALAEESCQSAEKMRKLEVDLEISEDENRKLKSKIVKLEQGISRVEERRNSLERQKKLLGAKLEEKQQELTQHEDELMQRLANLSQHDEAIENKLKEREEELLELGGKLRDVEYQRDQLHSKVNQLEAQMTAFEESSKRASELENENYNFAQEIGALQTEVKRVLADSEAKVSEKDSEIDQLELELTNQLAKIENERKQLQENLERTQDGNTELQDEVVRLQENVNSLEQLRSDLEKEITWLKMQNESLNQDNSELQTELEHLRTQYDTLVQNHQFEINALKQQIADMEAIRTQLSQNQTDDQVSVQNEMIKLKERLEQKEAEAVQLQQRNLQLQMAASGPVDDPFSNLQASPGHSATVALEEKIRELENDATLKDSRIQELQIEKDLVDDNNVELRKQMQLFQKSMDRALDSSEAFEAQLVQKSSELKELSEQLFQKVQPNVAAPTFSTSQFFGAPGDSSTVTLFDAAGDGWGWDEPVAVQQVQNQQVAAVPPTDNLQALRDQIEQFKSRNEAASKEIQELQGKLASTVDRDDEFHQLKDEIDILRAQNATLSQQVDEKATKLENVVQSLLEEQLKAEQLEEQLQNKESAVAAPSVASFFADSAAQGPVFEDLIVPKKAYLCTPSASEEREDWSVEEPAMAIATATSQHAVGFVDRELENLREQNELQFKQIREQTEQHSQAQVTVVQLQQELSQLQERYTKLEAHLNVTHQKEMEGKLADMADECLQLKDEIDIVRAQNASLSYEVDEKTSKLKEVGQMLFEEQMKVNQLEEQLQSKESVATAPSVASFFTDSAAQEPVFEDLVIPKKTYLCTPSASEEREDWPVEKPAMATAMAPSQHAVGRLDDRELENIREQNELQLKQIREQTEQHSQAQATVVQLQQELSQLQQRYAKLEADLNVTLASHQKEMEGKVAAMADECLQLKDEIDIVRAQNASLSYEVDEKTSKLKEVGQMLFEEQMKVNQLEEQLQSKESAIAAPSVASFFTDSAAQGPVFEDLIVPKKTYLCTPSASEEREDWSVEEPAMATAMAPSQHAVSFVDRELENLREQNELQLKQIREQTEQHLQAQQELNQLQQRCAALEMQLHQQQIDVEALHNQQAQLSSQHQEEQKKLKDELNQLKQQNQSLAQDRDAYLQLQDELDILKAQNNSLLQEMEEKDDRIKRVCRTLTEQETRVVDLEEQLASREHQFGGLQGQQGPASAVFEEIITPNKVHAAESSSANIQLEDDCWGADEAILEEKHQQTSSVALERRLSEKDDYIRQLEMEKERLLQEIVDLKVKSGKLLKKVKEYKAKSDNLQRRSASMETSELDLAIQEELNSQIKSLEGRLNEVQAEREKEAVEKDSLLKRIDVLVAANERFIEMKERQDVQMEIQLAKIKELNVKLQRLEDWGDESEPKESKPVEQIQGQGGEEVGQLKVRVQELQRDVQDLTVDNEELQALLDEEKSNVEILEKRVQQKDREIQELIEKIDDLSQDSRTIKSSLESLNQQKSKETDDLSVRLQQLMSKNTELTQQIEKMRTESLFQSSEQETILQEQLQQLSAQLQYKEAEIVHLSERIEQQAREDQTQSLVQEILVKNQEITALKGRVQQLQTDRQEMEHNLTVQITKDLASSRPDEKQQNPRIGELERLNQDLRNEKCQMEQELQVLNDQVLRSLEFEDRMKSTVLELDAKNIEIEALKASLEMMKQASTAENSTSSEQSTPKTGTKGEDDLQRQIQKMIKERADLEANYRITLEQRDAHWAHVVEERGAQVAESWKQHVDLRETEFSVIEKSLKEEIDRLQSESGAAPPAPVDPTVIQNMKDALEAQELEIVTLKEQLAIRSAEYARLAAQVDPFAVKHASNMVTSEPRSQPPMVDGDKVPRSELELALYMIYQRDMRCEELELELRNLLTERDSLQLRLSNALRQHEEFKRKLTAAPGEPSGDSASDVSKTTTPEKSLQQIVQESGISAMAAATAGSDVSDLNNKLSELHAIDHGRDKRVQEERGERHRQMTLIQRDLAYMPLEAAAKIAGTNISQTESSPQEPQSASSVLINWILGKKAGS
ncbi:protein lava lamp-like [Ochlerotatus camptorhynchus]|uniref:protein lava lamp-like n=1 Tax=Ochlerotatus camptorhynchus TaxID=644619 RepID=UPI0031D3C5EB